MSVISRRLSLALASLALCFGAPAAHAQASLPYWTTALPTGFGSSFTAPGSNTYTSLAGVGGSSAGEASFSSRFDLPNGWFIGSERGGLASNGLSSAWSSMSGLSYEGSQVGYNFKNADMPVSIYAGFGTLKYNTGIGGALPGFDSTSSTVSGYSAHAGVELRPISNLSLSLGVGFAQQPAGVDTGTNSLVAPVASPFAFGARR